MQDKLSELYSNRFKNTFDKRERVWKLLNENFFQKFINENGTTLEIAAGYGHFINNIKSKNKIAIDLNIDTKKYIQNDVLFIKTSSSEIKEIQNNSIDSIFISNFFEHITKDEILKTVSEIKRILKVGGNLIILQPNIRYLANDYWMYFDHITPIDDRAVVEVLELNSFKILKNYPKFLPYTMQGKLPTPNLFIKIYLICKPLWYIFGKQALVIATK